ncbi:MAG TPA: bifunctional oligoribonuclease/PAP phosphatase NrnA [Candidatus Eisenbergiella merdipullorum]|uniref:Bifunctional oligoribonuclease/PAP phosphatase NrnA n=1 Tax=Candidatus Eisenbergiella merdipullorum TaxID=2838553 RepID=A0A9D2I8W6_9FIRM|nr:bifunctional oligoribonuclease/PAP phosphatase NrnA [Candidatus Eisenbergiella merdipullorum]
MNLLEECKGAGSIGIGGHVRPDGDCIGSCMGLYLYLKKELPQADIQVFLEKPADIYGCISRIGDVDSTCDEQKKFDVFFALDTSADRIGVAGTCFKMAGKRINIDHHISNENGCGDVNFVDPSASSTSELVYRLIGSEGLDRDIAEALYMGIVHDTGCFQYSCTSPSTLRAAADLISYGFDFSRLIEETFYEKNYLQAQILGRALLESIRFMDGRCVVSALSRKTLDFYGAGPQDLEGIVSQLRSIKGVECAIFLYETGVQEYKVSLRSSEKVNVAAIASYFGGGGHIRAAGCTMMGTAYDVINNLSLHIERQLDGRDEKE